MIIPLFPETTRPSRKVLTVLEAYGYTGDGPASFVDVDGHTLFITGGEQHDLGINIRGTYTGIAAYPVILEAVDGSLHNLYRGGPTIPYHCTHETMVEAIPRIGANLCGEHHPKRHSTAFRYAADGRLVIGTDVDLVHMRVYERVQVGGAPVTSFDDYHTDVVYDEPVLIASFSFVDPNGVRELIEMSGGSVKIA